MGRVGAWCAWPEASVRIAPTIEALEKCVSSCGTLPKDSLNTTEGGSKKAMLIEYRVRPPLYDPLGGSVGAYVIMSEEAAQ